METETVARVTSALGGLVLLAKPYWPAIQAFLADMARQLKSGGVEEAISDVGRVAAYRMLRPLIDKGTRTSVWRQIEPGNVPEETKPAGRAKK